MDRQSSTRDGVSLRQSGLDFSAAPNFSVGKAGLGQRRAPLEGGVMRTCFASETRSAKQINIAIVNTATTGHS